MTFTKQTNSVLKVINWLFLFTCAPTFGAHRHTPKKRVAQHIPVASANLRQITSWALVVKTGASQSGSLLLLPFFTVK
jgi:hypothetical protein